MVSPVLLTLILAGCIFQVHLSTLFHRVWSDYFFFKSSLLSTWEGVSSSLSCSSYCIRSGSCSGFLLGKNTEGAMPLKCSLISDDYTTSFKTGSMVNEAVDIYLVSTPFEKLARTIVFIYYQSFPNEYLFLQASRNFFVNTISPSDTCVSIVHTAPVNVPKGDMTLYEAWAKGDTCIGMEGAEMFQGQYNYMPALGTPAIWTSNDTLNTQYTDQNHFGDHYWMIDVTMDCEQTFIGWLEVSTVVLDMSTGQSKYEKFISQQMPCFGEGAWAPYRGTSRHIAVCGKVNVFKFNSGYCDIHELNPNM